MWAAGIEGAQVGAAEERFRLLYDRSYSKVLGYALRRADSRDDAIDVVAETFLVAWRRLDDVPEGERALLWLYGTARRVLANQVRSSTRQRRVADRLAQLPAPHGLLDSDDGLSAAIGAAFRRLSDSDRELLLLAGWEELDPAQIAEVTGGTRGAVRVRLHRARARFDKELEREDVKRPGRYGHQTGRWAMARPGTEETL
jgi:RNA polymerase sigma-70 factor (ECF subfamily)